MPADAQELDADLVRLGPAEGLEEVLRRARDLVDFLGVSLRRIDGVPRGTTMKVKDAASGLLGRGLAGEGAVAARPALRLRLGQRQRHAGALALPAFGLEVELLQGAVRHLARRNTVAVGIYDP